MQTKLFMSLVHCWKRQSWIHQIPLKDVRTCMYQWHKQFMSLVLCLKMAAPMNPR